MKKVVEMTVDCNGGEVLTRGGSFIGVYVSSQNAWGCWCYD